MNSKIAVFGSYSRYYNLLYRDKDYAGEVEYVHALLQRHCSDAKNLLDLGCGTGRHDLLLAKRGLGVVGVDRSEEMLDVARRSILDQQYICDAHRSALAPPPLFHLGDIRTLRLDRRFDSVISLFHVVSYLSSTDDLRAAFSTARAHLAPGGVFIFDCWYGPTVLTDRPVVRIKRLEDEEITVTRIVEPTMLPNDNVVDLHYTVQVRDKKSGGIEELHETHRMRYLFQPEIEFLLNEAGLQLVEASEWMTGRPLGFDTWGGCFVAKQLDER
jgi:SAM-dependent methyltransferase